jgi:hypothetical protein
VPGAGGQGLEAHQGGAAALPRLPRAARTNAPRPRLHQIRSALHRLPGPARRLTSRNQHHPAPRGAVRRLPRSADRQAACSAVAKGDCSADTDPHVGQRQPLLKASGPEMLGSHLPKRSSSARVRFGHAPVKGGPRLRVCHEAHVVASSECSCAPWARRSASAARRQGGRRAALTPAPAWARSTSEPTSVIRRGEIGDCQGTATPPATAPDSRLMSKPAVRAVPRLHDAAESTASAQARYARRQTAPSATSRTHFRTPRRCSSHSEGDPALCLPATTRTSPRRCPVQTRSRWQQGKCGDCHSGATARRKPVESLKT